jgi:hypothetical protein
MYTLLEVLEAVFPVTKVQVKKLWEELIQCICLWSKNLKGRDHMGDLGT